MSAKKKSEKTFHETKTGLNNSKQKKKSQKKTNKTNRCEAKKNKF